MSLAQPELREPGNDAGPPGTESEGSGSPHRRPWTLWLAAFVVAALLVLTGLADRYQPLSFGGAWGGSFPGLPAGSGLSWVNHFGSETGQIYVPPQGKPFTVLESIQNSGPEPVTIEAVTVLRPDQLTVPDPWPVRLAGPVLYRPEGGAQPAFGRPVVGMTLGAGQTIQLGIPVRLTSACHSNGWTGLDVFYVQERFLAFTHWVAIPLGTPLTFHQPSIVKVQPKPGGPFTCPSR